MSLSNQQLAELLVGVAKANAALVRAAIGPNAFHHMQVVPALQAAGNVQARDITLDTIYARMLLMAVGGNVQANQFTEALNRIAPD